MIIVRRSLSEWAFKSTRERILSIRIARLTLVRQATLAARLGISKIPFREVLTQWVEYGLLYSSTNSGHHVPALSIGEADAVFAMSFKIQPEATVQAREGRIRAGSTLRKRH